MSNFEIKHTKFQVSSGKKNLRNQKLLSECSGEKTHRLAWINRITVAKISWQFQNKAKNGGGKHTGLSTLQVLCTKKSGALWTAVLSLQMARHLSLGT